MSATERITPDELRGLFLFESLDDGQLAWLAARGRVRRVPADGWIYRQGEPADEFFVLLEGTGSLLSEVRGDQVETNRTDQRGVYAGATQAYVEAVPQRYRNSYRAVTDVVVFALPAADFAHMVRSWFPMAVHLLEGLYMGLTATNAITGQRERLAALGSLTAGLTHELNNPAAAAVRASASLSGHLTDAHRDLEALLDGTDGARWLDPLFALERSGHPSGRPVLDPGEEADREEAIGDWLDDRQVPGAWDAAGALVEAGLDLDALRAGGAQVPPERLAAAVSWLSSTLQAHQLAREIDEAVRRISSLVDAARQYSQMDRAPLQEADLHDLLDATLTMLSAKIPPGVTVVRDYDRSIGPIPVYAAELNQVWTNLIVNAVQAMGPEGTLTLTTRIDGDCATVEVGDTGHGVPEEVQGRIFEPFFTTKAVGEGTGLGLDISYRIVARRHRGDLTVRSEPGATTFTVSLPRQAPA